MKTAAPRSRYPLAALSIALVLGGNSVASALPEAPTPVGIFADGFDTSPVAHFTFGASGLAVTFTDQSVDDFGTLGAWTWDFGDGGTSTSQNAVRTYPAAGT